MLYLAIFPLLAAAAPGRPCSHQAQASANSTTNITLNIPELYPENIDYDPQGKVAYLSMLYKSAVAAVSHDSLFSNNGSAQTKFEMIKFDKLTDRPDLHCSGVQWDSKANLLSVMVNAGAAFVPPQNGVRNLSGDNFLVKYDPKTKKEKWRVNLTDLAQQKCSGFQDIEHDDKGNSFVVGTFPGCLVRVTDEGSKGNATMWAESSSTNSSLAGFTGLARKDDFLLVLDDANKKLLRFNMADEKGQARPVEVTGDLGSDLDGVYLPGGCRGEVLLLSSNTAGTVVLQSPGGKWDTAKVLGTVANSQSDKKLSAVATVEIEGKIFVDFEDFNDPEKHDKSSFFLEDITAQVKNLTGESCKDLKSKDMQLPKKEHEPERSTL